MCRGGQSCSVGVCDERTYTHNDMHLCLMRSNVPPWKQQLQTSLRRFPISGASPHRSMKVSFATLLMTSATEYTLYDWYTGHTTMIKVCDIRRYHKRE